VGNVIALRPLEDPSLAARCVAGEGSAQRELFDRHRRHVHATLYRILGSNGDMQDLVQETFLEIFRSLPGFRGDASLSTWLDRIAARVAYAYIRRRPPQAARLELVPETASGDPSAEDRAMARDAARRLYAVLDRIEARQRIAFTLHVVDGRPLQEVAQVMDASLVLTKTRVWRATREIEKRARRDPTLAGFLRNEIDVKKKG
jgi:RNA polymerase sigma-70 factor (ECF subfamily)